MKKRLLSLLLLVTMVLSIAGCGAPKLEGTYTADMILAKVTYEFEKDYSVTCELKMASVVVFSQEGTYTINDDETEITFDFNETTEEADEVPKGMDILSGTFSYKKGETSVTINDVEYEKKSE